MRDVVIKIVKTVTEDSPRKVSGGGDDNVGCISFFVGLTAAAVGGGVGGWVGALAVGIPAWILSCVIEAAVTQE